MLEDQLAKDLKTSMLAGDSARTETLKMLKSALLYKAVELGVRDAGLTEEQVIDVLSKIENRNEFSYILNHEFGLFIGRFIGASTFLLLAYFINADIALRYALLIIGTMQLLSIVIAKQLLKQQNTLENEEI